MAEIARPRMLLLRLQVFSAGFAVMGLELLGSRLITPVFGNSIWTWGSLIGVVLSGLAAGYQLGGRLADRSPSPRKFATILFLGGVLVVIVPLVAPFAMSFSQLVLPGDQYGPLLATTLVLGAQTLVLGLTSPYAVRLASRSISSVGNVAGGLYSLSTVGSIAGTFATVFVLIPSFDVRTIIFGLGLVMMVVSVPALPSRSTVPSLALFFLILSPSFLQTSPQVTPTNNGGHVVFEKQTPYSILDVVDYGNQRVLYLNGLAHSVEYINNPEALFGQYPTYFNLGLQLIPSAKTVLLIGGGGFTIPKWILAKYPGVHIDVAEIDPDVITTAQTYFSVQPSPSLTIFNEDGRIYLGETAKAYDIIMLDAYAKTYVPFNLMTQEFFNILSLHLSPHGVIISNMIGSLSGDTSDLVRSYFRTAASVFNNSAVFWTDTSDPSKVQNLEIAFRRQSDPPLSNSIIGVDRNLTLHAPNAASEGFEPTGGYEAHLYRPSFRTGDVPLLTDGYAPVETLLNPLTLKPYALQEQFGGLSPATQLPVWETVLIIVGVAATAAGWLALVSRERDPTGPSSGGLASEVQAEIRTRATVCLQEIP